MSLAISQPILYQCVLNKSHYVLGPTQQKSCQDAIPIVFPDAEASACRRVLIGSHKHKSKLREIAQRNMLPIGMFHPVNQICSHLSNNILRGLFSSEQSISEIDKIHHSGLKEPDALLLTLIPLRSDSSRNHHLRRQRLQRRWQQLHRTLSQLDHQCRIKQTEQRNLT